MNLNQKLIRLKAKQQEIERQMAAQAALENAAVARAFSLILESTPTARRSAESSSALQALGNRERDLFTDWLNRIEPAAVTSTETFQVPSTDQNPLNS